MLLIDIEDKELYIHYLKNCHYNKLSFEDFIKIKDYLIERKGTIELDDFNDWVCEKSMTSIIYTHFYEIAGKGIFRNEKSKEDIPYILYILFIHRHLCNNFDVLLSVYDDLLCTVFRKNLNIECFKDNKSNKVYFQIPDGVSDDNEIGELNYNYVEGYYKF